jgi:hypothetical protein
VRSSSVLNTGRSENLRDPEEDSSHRLCLSLHVSLTCISNFSIILLAKSVDVTASKLSFCAIN